MSRRMRIVTEMIGIALLLGSIMHIGIKADARQERKTVRVGYFAFNGYHEIGEEGKRSGYGYDILQHMVGYSNWQYEYVGYEKSWNEMQDMLRNGEIDLLTSAQKTTEREAEFDFSDDSIGTSAAILTVPSWNVKYLEKDYVNWSGMRIGMLEGNSRNEQLQQFAQDNGFTYKPVYFQTSDELLVALQNGEMVDAAITSNLRAISGERILAQFASAPFYVIVKKGNTELLDEINHILAQMNSTEPGLAIQLMEKYYAPDRKDALSLSAEERDYVAEQKEHTFTAILNPERRPFSYWEDGKMKGILYDLVQGVIEQSSLNIKILELHTYEEYRKRMETGEYDIRLDAACSYEQAEKLGYRKTVSYMDLSISRLYKKNGSGVASVALLSEADLSEKYKEYLIDEYTDVVYYDTVDEVVDAVKSEKQGMAYLYRRSAEMAAYTDVTNRLVVEDVYGYENSYSMTIKASQDPRLYSIMNKTVASITEKEMKKAEDGYLAYDKRPFTLLGFLYSEPIAAVLLVCAIFAMLALFALLVHLVRKKKRSVIMLAKEKRRNELLADALAAAESADAAKSQFLSRVSHEMRTPLNAIIGFLDLSKGASQEKISEYLANSDIAAKQLLSVINDVLDMSSIEAGKLKLCKEDFSLKQMLHSITDMYLVLCEQKGIAFETQMQSVVDEWLLGDAFRVNQILMNLLNNSVKFTKKGQVSLLVSQQDVGGERVFIHLEVKDTGCGMSEEMQQRLFRPFEQEDASTAQKYGGSGLGLSIVKNLVTMMGGAIRVDSIQGMGSTFVVDLPFERCERSKILQEPVVIGRSLRVLCVDDEVKERQYLSAVMDRMKVRYSMVEDGQSALDNLSKAEEMSDPYNVCLVDWRMPNLNGIDTTKRIREQYGRDVVVIVVSAYEKHQVGESAKEAGADLFIPKPLFQSTLNDLFMTLTNGEIAKEKKVNNERKLTGIHILLAEDNALNRLVAEGIIERFGMTCDSVVDGNEVCNQFLQSEPGTYQIILMDIQMPGRDGYEAAEVIRQSSHPEAKTIPIIALTANAFKEDVTKALSFGMNAHVAKPIEPDMLADVIETYCCQ